MEDEQAAYFIHAYMKEELGYNNSTMTSVMLLFSPESRAVIEETVWDSVTFTFTNPMILGSSQTVDKSIEEMKNLGIDLSSDDVFNFMRKKEAVDAADGS